MSARRPTSTGRMPVCSRLVTLLGAWVLAALALGTVPVSAAITYPFDGQLAPAGGSFEFLDASSAAVNDFNGDAYVADSGSGVVDVFDSGGAQIGSLDSTTTPAGSFGGGAVSVAANNGTGEVYVLDSTDNVVDAFDSSGAYICQITGSSTPSASECNGPAGSATPAGGLSTPGGITVDQVTGEVYVIDANNGVVDIFGAGGAYLRQISLASVPGGFSSFNTRGIAVNDFNGHIYVADSGPVLLYEFDAAGNYLTTWSGSNTPAGSFGGGYLSVAADDTSGAIYVTETVHEITDVFDASGNYLEQFGHSYETPRGTAVDQASGKIYVSNNHSASNQPSVVYILGPGATVFGPAVVREESSTNVTSTSARLNASVDLHNDPATYYFQYGTSTSYGTEVPAPPGAPLGSGEETVEGQPQQLEDLLTGTTYHYRVVTVTERAPGVFETLDGPDETFTTQAASSHLSLPDGRAWEMVSPPDKRGAQILAIGQYSGEGAVIQSAATGMAMTYLTSTPTEGEPQGFTNYMQVLSTRGSGGWGSRDIEVPHESATEISIGKGQEYRFFSEDLSLGVLQPFGVFMPSLSAEASEQTAYLRTDYINGDTNVPCVSSCYHPLVTGASGFANVPQGTTFGDKSRCPAPKEGPIMCGPVFVGSTPDLSHIVLKSDAALTSTPTGGVDSLYEWSGGKLALVSVLPGGEVASSSQLGFQFVSADARDAISEDGSRVVWSEYGGGEHLYVRDTAKEETVQLDAVQGGSGEGVARPAFQIASRDGSRVFFTDAQRLTADSGAREGQPDLYECDMAEVAGKLKCALSDLTPLSAGESAYVDGWVLGASEDGSWVYFVANGVLASGAVKGTCAGEVSTDASMCNLYVRHSGVTSLIAILSGTDNPSWNDALSHLTARVSPNGRWLAFMSQRELTGYDTRDAVTGKRDEEVYLYDAEANASAGRLVCASCNPTGARPVGAEFGGSDTIVGGDRVWNRTLAANIPGWTPETLSASLYQSRYLSDAGRLFFNSSDALVPQDVNGAEDVYQYEPPDVGDCESASATYSERSNGCVGLISAGTSAEESGFLDASQTGGDVFFLTTARLSGADRDTALDIYDAHECTAGSPCFAQPPAQPPACDTGDSCKASPSSQPEVFGSPASATFTGAGNVVAQASKPAIKPKGLTRAQKLARALRACRKKKGRRRAVCRRQATARYAAKSSAANAIKKGRG